MKPLLAACSVVVAIVTASPALAQQSPIQAGGGMGHMGGMPINGVEMPKGQSPASDELMIAMHRMDENMMSVDDPDPSRAWAKKMIAHHEGAIAMSQIELRYGKDREARRMAEKTIAEQRRSIAEIRSWLSRH